MILNGNSLVVQWFRLHAVTAKVSSLVGELRSHKPHVIAKKVEINSGTNVHPLK